jgi:hypothetical protein
MLDCCFCINARYLYEVKISVRRIEPYRFFKNPNDNDANADAENIFLHLPNSMKKQITTQIKTQIDRSTSEILGEINEIINKY